ncbi:MAG: hemerythrin family protein [Clostridiales bacterium]|nr:hemerythrin family protein [Clostridiales bacterium]
MFNWKEEYCFGLSEIDSQHQKLFEIGSRFSYTASLEDDFDHYDEIIQILEELTDYTEYHFQYEESLLQQANYPEYDKQTFEHTFFVKRLKKISNKDLEASQKEAMTEIISFLSDWITGHILDSDTKYIECLKAAGLGGTK